MADNTPIEWTDATWNPITGCSVVSPGCTNCYAMKLAGTRLQHHASRAGLTTPSKAGPVWNGEVRLNADQLAQPLRWRRPRKIFVCAHGDLFHESVPDSWIDQVFAVMALSPQHTYQVLTKRAARMRAYMAERSGRLARFMIDEYVIKAPDTAPRGRAIAASWPVQSVGDIDDPDDVAMRQWPLPNVWLGVSAEDQARADERIPDLLATPAAVRFVSAEPLLGAMGLRRWMPAKRPATRPGGEPFLVPHFYMTTCEHCGWTGSSELCGDIRYDDDADITCAGCGQIMAGDDGGPGLDWVIVGGESGPGARPMHPDWARRIRDDCAAAGVPFFFKQWGAWECRHDRDKDDPDWRDSADIDRWPNSQWLNLAGGQGFHGDRVVRVCRVGKKAAGRTLDGATHDAMPGAGG